MGTPFIVARGTAASWRGPRLGWRHLLSDPYPDQDEDQRAWLGLGRRRLLTAKDPVAREHVAWWFVIDTDARQVAIVDPVTGEARSTYAIDATGQIPDAPRRPVPPKPLGSGTTLSVEGLREAAGLDEERTLALLGVFAHERWPGGSFEVYDADHGRERLARPVALSPARRPSSASGSARLAGPRH